MLNDESDEVRIEAIQSICLIYKDFQLKVLKYSGFLIFVIILEVGFGYNFI